MDRCNYAETLSGIETFLIPKAIASCWVAITLKPSQGLKRVKVLEEELEILVAITLKPSQGLKQCCRARKWPLPLLLQLR